MFAKVRFSKQDKDLKKFKWRLDSNGYPRATISVNNRKYAHQIVMERMLNRDLVYKEEVDHKHHNLLDCRRSQLRLTDRMGNMQNRKINFLRGTSKGHHGGWQATVSFKGLKISVGTFQDRLEASIFAEAKRTMLSFLS